MAAMYMNASTAPMTGVGGEANPMNAVDAARNLVSVDSARQNDMRDQMDKVWGGQ
jgi:hypothetical protein